MNDKARAIIGDDVADEMRKAELENLDDDEAEYKVYIHVLRKEITGYEYDRYYVGQTVRQLKVRFGENGRFYKNSKAFFKAIKEFGWDRIEHYCLAKILTKDQATYYEKLLIKKLKSNLEEYGYNKTIGGIGGNTKPETPVKQYDLDGNYINYFDSAADAAKSIGVGRSDVTHACGRHGVCGGYMWRYADEIVTGPYLRATQRTLYQFSLDGVLIDSFVSYKMARKIVGKSVRISKKNNLRMAYGCYFSYDKSLFDIGDVA